MKVNENRYNRGTKYGNGLIQYSLKKLGCARSIVSDKDDNIICGNDVFLAAKELGIKIVTIDTVGDVLICVRRMDISINDTKGKEIAIVDNLAQTKNLSWDTNNVISDMEKNPNFDPRVWGGYECVVKELSLEDLFNQEQQTVLQPQKSEDFIVPVQLTLFD